MNAKPPKEGLPPNDIPDPVDVVDGIPDRSADRSVWKYVVMAAVFSAWLAFLAYCWLAGGANR